MAEDSSGFKLTIVKFPPSFYKKDGIEKTINRILATKRDEETPLRYKGDFECHNKKAFGERDDQFYWAWVYGYFNNDQPGWVHDFLSYFPGSEESVKQISASSACYNGIVVVKMGEDYYGLLFGKAVLLFRNHCFSNFGIGLAKKLFNISSIKAVKSKHIGTTTNRSEREFYEPSFYLPENGETVASISGEITPYGDEETQATINDILTLCYPKAFASFDFFVVNLLSSSNTLDSIRRVVACFSSIEKANIPEQCPLPTLIAVPKKNCDLIEKACFENLMDKTHDFRFCVSGELLYQSAQIYDLGTADGFVIADDRFETVSGDLTFSEEKDIRKFLIDHKDVFDSFEKMSVFAKFTVKDEETHRKIGDFLRFFDAEVDVDCSHYCLSRGRWWEYNDELMRRLEINVAHCWEKCDKQDNNEFKYSSDQIKNWPDDEKRHFCRAFRIKGDFPEVPSYNESKFNFLISEKHNRTIGLFDRLHIPGQKLSVEPCDLYDTKNQTLIHVKIGDSGDLAEAFRQALDSAKLLSGKKMPIDSRLGPSFTGEFKNVEVLFFSKGADDFSIPKSKSFSLWIAFTEWYQGISNLNLNPILVIRGAGN